MNHIDESLYSLFKTRAEELSVNVRRASNAGDAIGIFKEIVEEPDIKKIAAAPLNLLDPEKLRQELTAPGVEYTVELNRDVIEKADLGVSQFDMGIAQLGSIYQDASSLHTRLVSMLPPVHLGLLPTDSLVESFADALEWIQQKYNGVMPPYLSFITGPSKTADIERELTVGVHGPGKLIILCIDNAGENNE